VLKLSATLDVEQDETSRRCRIVVRHFPWPLRPSDVRDRILEDQAAGRLEGLQRVSDDSSADEARLSLELEHVAFVAPARKYLESSKLCELSVPVELTVRGNVAPALRCDLEDLLRVFIEHRKELAVKKLDLAVARARARAQQAEAVCLAVELLEPVLEVMRRADDDAQAIEALTTFLRPEQREALARLPFPASHDYARGFTREQARYLVGVRRLGARTRESAYREWARLLGESAEAQRSLSSRQDILEVVRGELEAALVRFDEPRRSRLR
jgi:DNA gyrase subunit A